MTQDSHSHSNGDRLVFVSYASNDAAIANALVEGLERQGLRCWIAPRDVSPGSHYAEAIVHAINGSRVLVLVLSRHAVNSPHVGKELERASSKQHTIMAIRIDTSPLSAAFEYFLSESHWIELDAGGPAAAAGKLAVAIKGRIDPSAAPQPTTSSHDRTAGERTGGATVVKPAKWVWLGGAAIVLVALAYVGIDRFWPSRSVVTESPVAASAPAATILEKSIAVLPFIDMSEKKDQEYLADGMAEEILNLLAKAPDLLVPARTSSFYFKGKSTKIPEIAHELGVAHVLEGSIRRVGDHLRVTAQLIRADNGYHLWSETYDRDLKDLFKVQDDIASAVAQALQIKLMGGELSRRKGGTQNLDAYQLFLQADSALLQNTRSSLETVDRYVDQAIELDPNYGMAWLLRANVDLLQAENGFREPTEGYEQAREGLQHTLQLSAEIAEAHALLQSMLMTVDRDWAGAKVEEQKALAIDPTNSTALQTAGVRSIALGRWDDAERQLRLALTRDPLNPYVLWALGAAYYGAGRLQESEGVYRKLLETTPDFSWTRMYLAKTLLAQGKPEDALALLQQETDEGFRLMLLPTALQAAGRKAEADEALKAQIDQWGDIDAFCIAGTYAYRGDHDAALQWLERAYEQHSSSLREILSEPVFRNDSHYLAFLRKMNLPTKSL